MGILPLPEAFAPVLGIKPGAAGPLEAILAPLSRNPMRMAEASVYLIIRNLVEPEGLTVGGSASPR